MIGYVFVGLCVIQLLVPEVTCVTYNYKTCPKNWIPRGCMVDDDRGMTTLFDDRKNGNIQIDWNNKNAYIWDLACRCREAALNIGNSWFALENYGICFSAKGKLKNFLTATKKKFAPKQDCVGKLKLGTTNYTGDDGELCVGVEMRAFLYEIVNAGGPAGGNPGENEEEAVEKKSCNKISDVVLVIDTSGSVGVDNFKLVKEFVQRFVYRYDFTKGKSRLALVTFDENVYVHLTWLDSAIIGVNEIRKKIDDIKYSGGSTMTQRALKHVINHIVKPYKRPGVPIAIFTMSDGGSWKGTEQLPEPAGKLRALGCKMIAIGIGKEVNTDELKIITNDQKNIFLFSSFVNLIDHAAKYLNQLIGRACV